MNLQEQEQNEDAESLLDEIEENREKIEQNSKALDRLVDDIQVFRARALDACGDAKNLDRLSHLWSGLYNLSLTLLLFYLGVLIAGRPAR